MSWIAPTLWDLLTGRERRSPARPERAAAPTSSGRPSMRDRYDELVLEMKQEYGVRVRRWRNSSSGCAWRVAYADGRVSRLIESPYPKGPMSCAIFLHEIGHHAIGFGTYRPRCLEEYHAWRWSLETMRARGFNVTDSVTRRMEESVRYAIEKAMRRGLKRLPAELLPYVDGRVVVGPVTPERRAASPGS